MGINATAQKKGISETVSAFFFVAVAVVMKHKIHSFSLFYMGVCVANTQKQNKK